MKKMMRGKNRESSILADDRTSVQTFHFIRVTVFVLMFVGPLAHFVSRIEFRPRTSSVLLFVKSCVWDLGRFVKVERDKEAWKAQCLTKQLYIKNTVKQIYKAIHKAHDMLEKAEAHHQEVIPTGKNGQRLVNFLEEAKDHYEQVKAFYGYNCNKLNAI